MDDGNGDTRLVASKKTKISWKTITGSEFTHWRCCRFRYCKRNKLTDCPGGGNESGKVIAITAWPIKDKPTFEPIKPQKKPLHLECSGFFVRLMRER